MSEVVYEFDIQIDENDLANLYLHNHGLSENKWTASVIQTLIFLTIMSFPGIIGLYLVYDGLIVNSYIFIVALVLVLMPAIFLFGYLGSRNHAKEDKFLALARDSFLKYPDLYLKSKCTFSKSGIIEESLNATINYRWTGIKKIYTESDYIFIQTKSFITFIIPHRVFANNEQKKNFIIDINQFHRDGFTPDINDEKQNFAY
ncbi:MAG: YcxB family protein [Thermoplasmata archaeon]|nr:YcxB family protein [Thermoplasmata archaeon]